MCCGGISVWAFVVALLFAGSGPQAITWPAVFLCGLGVQLCTCSEFYSTQRFSWRCWFIAFGFFFLPGSVSLLSFGVGIGVRVVLGVRIRVVSMSRLLIFFSLSF